MAIGRIIQDRTTMSEETVLQQQKSDNESDSDQYRTLGGAISLDCYLKSQDAE